MLSCRSKRRQWHMLNKNHVFYSRKQLQISILWGRKFFVEFVALGFESRGFNKKLKYGVEKNKSERNAYPDQVDYSQSYGNIHRGECSKWRRLEEPNVPIIFSLSQLLIRWSKWRSRKSNTILSWNPSLHSVCEFFVPILLQIHISLHLALRITSRKFHFFFLQA